MIQIKHINLDKLVREYHDIIIKSLNFDDIKKTQAYKHHLNHKELIAYLEDNLNDLIVEKPSRLREHIKNLEAKTVRLQIFDERGKKKLSKHQKEANTFIRELKKIFDYDKKIKDKADFAKRLNIISCPYCNREYIYTFEDGSKKGEIRSLASLDHYYDKASYPFLALSFFNLIPSCHTCNSKFKTTINFYKKRHLHPYEDNFNTKAKFIQCFKPVTDDTKGYDLFSKERITVKIIPYDVNDRSTIQTIKTFRLNELYNEHKDIISELLLKKEVYTESYIDYLYNEYKGRLFNSREDLLRLITCGYMTDEDINKRPMSKLIKDIYEQIDLV